MALPPGLLEIEEIKEKLCSHTATFGIKIPFVPKKITIGFSASIAFKIVNQSKYALG